MMRMSVKTRCHTGQNFSQGQNAHNAAVNRLISKFRIEQPIFEVKRKEQVKDILASLKALVIDDIEFIKSVSDVKPTATVYSVDDIEV